MQEAMFYSTLENKVICHLCPHQCTLNLNQVGRCRVRQNYDGKLMSLNFGEISAIQVDPIEKKPLRDWLPGTEILSVGGYGCNLKCAFCQNHELSMGLPSTQWVTPMAIVEKTLQSKLTSIAYTYSEPFVFYEWMLETAQLTHEKGLKNVIVTNGLIEVAPLQLILPYIDAMNIDLKAPTDEIYKRLGGTTVSDILRTIEMASKSCHVEVAYLIVPKLNDDEVAFEQLLDRLKAVAPDVVLHLSRYFPRYHYEEPATDIGLMMRMRDIAIRKFTRVYLGNL